jgi:pimeloyl-ACP methyl ester carboxylesterase
MSTTGPVQEMIEERKKQKQNALNRLTQFTQEKLTLKRPVFFVPGWTDEDNTWWTTADKKLGISAKERFSEIFTNCDSAEYITFSEEESEGCKSFLDFGPVLRSKIFSKIGKSKEFDLIGHSMGGLDSVAAIIDDTPPLLKINSLITVATPHQGSELGEIGPIFKDYSPHHAMQCVNLDPDQMPIKYVNQPEIRKKLLDRVKELYCFMGTVDQAVMKSARLSKKDLDSDLYKSKVEILEIGGATHTGKDGITLDPRTILKIVSILMGFPLEKPKCNYGYIYKKA